MNSVLETNSRSGLGKSRTMNARDLETLGQDCGESAWARAQNSLLKALLTGVLSVAKRSTGSGLFYIAFGVAWFLGSAAMGFLYDKSILAVVIFSVVFQLLALPVFL